MLLKSDVSWQAKLKEWGFAPEPGKERVMDMFRIGWFSTGCDEAARKLLSTVYEAIRQGEIEAEIAFVFSNREAGEAGESDLFFSLVEGYSIPLLCLSYQRCQARGLSRQGYDREVMRLVGGLPFDLGVLAGYMLIVGEEMCRRFSLVNLHPALPGGPVGTWQEVIWQLIESRAEQSGVTMHRVTPELDRGPTVAYCTFPIQGEPFKEYWRGVGRVTLEVIKRSQGERFHLFRLLRREGVKRELPLIVATLKAFSEGRVKIEGKRVVDGEGRDIPGYDLTRAKKGER